MLLKRLITAAASIALMASPTIAAAQNAPASAPAVAQEVAPTSETLSGMQFSNNGLWIVVGLLVAAGVACLIWCGGGDHDKPASP